MFMHLFMSRLRLIVRFNTFSQSRSLKVTRHLFKNGHSHDINSKSCWQVKARVRLRQPSMFPAADIFLVECTESFWAYESFPLVCQLSGPFCTCVAPTGSRWFVVVVVFSTPAVLQKPLLPTHASLCSDAPARLLNTVLFSISTIHNSHAVASNIEQRDGAERSGGLLLV